jgi:Skp family chaperone for outer membrane proteins
MAGPPCCYDKAIELFNKAQGELIWYRKIVSKKDKKINKLQQEIAALKEKLNDASRGS